MSEAAPKLTAVQAQAVENGRQSLALSSGAGCGKTLVLALRFTRLLEEHPDPANALGRLVAITFTEKAAAEMRQRVRRELTKAAHRTTGEARRQYRQWISQLPQARISTIHSFCSALLRSRAIEAGVDPDFAVCADEMLSRSMIADAAQQAVLEAVEGGGQEIADLLAACTFQRVLDQVRDLVDMRSRFNPADFTDPAITLKRWQDALPRLRSAAWQRLENDAVIRTALAELATFHCTSPADKLLAFHEQALELGQRLVGDAASRTPETFEQMAAVRPVAVGSDKSWGGEKGAAKAVRDQIKLLRERLETEYEIFSREIGPADKQAAELLATLAQAAVAATKIYDARKRARGLLDFEDLLIRTEALLAADASVRDSLARQADQYLVDECQDTDALQMRLLNWLICGRGEGGAVPEGKLFLVGDAKQSIYRFRGAQVEVFEQLCTRLGREGNKSLDISFRTHRAGLEFVNHLFAPLLEVAQAFQPVSASQPGKAVPQYVPVKANRKELPPGPSVEILLAAPQDGGDDARTMAQAQAVLTARRIHQMIANQERRVWDRQANDWRAVRPGDIAILFARMTPSPDFERALAACDVPYYVVAGTGFFRQQEVFDLLNALRVIDNPFDDVSLMGVLRSSMFALDDNALMHIASRCSRPYLHALQAADLSDALPPGDAAALRTAVTCITRLHAAKDAMAIDAMIGELLGATGFEASLLAQGRGSRPLGNLRMLIDMARRASSDGMSLAAFIAQAGEMILDDSRYEQAAVAAEEQDVVRLMTIHKAKGLEFPVVIVPDLSSGSRPSTAAVLGRADLGLTCKPPQPDDGEEDAPTPLMYDLARRLEAAEDRREDLRRLYVAVTRHQDHLILVGADVRSESGQFKPSSSPLAEMDSVLGIAAAIDSGQQTLPYAGGFQASVASQAAGAMPRIKPAARKGTALLAQSANGDDLAARVLDAAGGESLADTAAEKRPPSGVPGLLGVLPAENAQLTVAVTALADFQTCPMLYRWRYELAVPEIPARAIIGKQGDGDEIGVAMPPGPAIAGFDAAQQGTLFHRCMELLNPPAAQTAGELVSAAAAQLGMDLGSQATEAAAQLQDMLDRLVAQPFWGGLSSSRRRLPELSFALECGRLTLRGQIDLLYQDEGGWHIIDYKSDRVTPDDVPAKVEHYRLQMAAYALAAAKILGEPVADATLYFLRPGVAACVYAGQSGQAARSTIDAVAEELLRCRRGGRFERRRGQYCNYCHYRTLCE
ncbi:MAG: UvrD-helicase domain-containing protein [Planctomycetaceae bacterium]|nr:UvrD-helicase domain-containing protein [Planctomycetaceae bacterium]